MQALSEAIAWIESLRPWTLVLLYMGAWTLVGALVSTFLRRSLARLAATHKTTFNIVLAASLPRAAGIAVFLFAMSYGVRGVVLRPEVALYVHKIFPIAVGILGISVVMRVALRSIEAAGRSNPELQSSAGIGRAVTWIAGVSAIALFVSDALGISLIPSLTALGIGSLAVGLGLQETISNFFAGLYLLVDKPVKPGEFVKIDTYEGFVETIGWRSTHLRTVGQSLVILPNATLSKATITNYDRPTRTVAVDVRIEVASDADIDKVEDALADEAKRLLDVDGVLEEPAPLVRFAPGFVDGALAFTISCHARSYGEQGKVQHEIRRRVLRRLRKDGIALPTRAPQTRVVPP